MTDFFRIFVEAMKDGKKVFGSLFVFSLLFLIMPNWLRALLHCAELPKTFYTVIGIICLLSLAVLLVFFLSFMKEEYRFHMKKRYSIKLLKELTAEEKNMLKEYVVKGKNTLRREEEDGVSTGLRAKNILYRAANVSSIGCPPLYPHNIHPWAL